MSSIISKTVSVLIVFVLCFGLAAQAMALPQADIDAINGPWPNWAPGGGKCGTGAGGSVNVSSDNAKTVYDYLTTSAGLPPFQAAGILGNMQAESGVQPQRLESTPSGSITTAAQAINSSRGWGLVQWTPAGKIIKPTLAAGKKPDDIIVQLDFLWAQLTTGTEKGAGDALKATTNVVDAAVTFLTKYEHPSPKALANSRQFRIDAAQQMLKQYGNGAPSGVNPTTSGCASSDALISGNAQELANKLIGEWGKNLTGNSVVLQDLTAVSKGQKIQNSDSCGNSVTIDTGLLQTLATIITKYKLTVLNIITGHGCDRFFHPKGAATDLGGITELSTGRSTNFTPGSSGDDPTLDGQLVLFLASILPADAGLGQSNCAGRSNVKAQVPPKIHFFSDGCNHQHIQMRTNVP